METIDIVAIVKDDAITKLVSSCDNEILDKLKEDFEEYEREVFAALHYCYLNYNQTTDFVIDLDNVWKWMGYSHKASAKSTLVKNFTLDREYKILPVGDNCEPEIETFLMNTNTFKIICLRALTKKTNVYFINLEKILNPDVCENATGESQEQPELYYNSVLSNSENKEIRKQESLLRELRTDPNLIYIVRVKTLDDGCYIIKIGDSMRCVENIIERYKWQYNENVVEPKLPKNNIEFIFAEQQNFYGDDVVLLDVFPVIKSHEFECWIHNNPKIAPSLYTDLVGYTNQTDLFLIGRGLTYKAVLEEIYTNIEKYNV